MPAQKTIDVFFEDYTVLPIGHTIPKGTAAECPHCKRVGLDVLFEAECWNSPLRCAHSSHRR
jgi:hypothetical protein